MKLHSLTIDQALVDLSKNHTPGGYHELRREQGGQDNMLMFLDCLWSGNCGDDEREKVLLIGFAPPCP